MSSPQLFDAAGRRRSPVTMPALRRQGHCHHERRHNQDEDEPVGIADPLDKLKRRLTTRATYEPAPSRGIWSLDGHNRRFVLVWRVPAGRARTSAALPWVSRGSRPAIPT